MASHSHILGFFLVLLLYLISWELVDCYGGSLFSASVKIEEAFNLEKEIGITLRTYLKKESQRIQNLKNFVQELKEYNHVANCKHPTDAYNFIKINRERWEDINKRLKSLSGLDYYDDLFGDMKSRFPSFDEIDMEDLEGISYGIFVVQDMYNLKASDLAEGRVGPGLESFPLSAENCRRIGMVAFNESYWQKSADWLGIAKEKFDIKFEKDPNKEKNREKYLETVFTTLDYKAFAHYLNKDYENTLKSYEDMVQFSPDDDIERVKENIETTKALIETNPNSSEVVSIIQDRWGFDWKDDYFRLCNGKHKNTTKEDANQYYCFLDYSKKYRSFDPPRIEILKDDPRIIMYHDIITSQEAGMIKGLAKPLLERSQVVEAATGNHMPAKYRVSSGYFFDDDYDLRLEAINRRVQQITGLNLDNSKGQIYSEGFQVVNYGIGGSYDPHYDHVLSMDPIPEDSHLFGSRNRLATLMFYLTNVQFGGYTVFPKIDTFLKPVKNSAVLWFNIKKSGEGEDRVLHAGCPVLGGSKWVANKWIHEYGQEFVYPCSLNPEE